MHDAVSAHPCRDYCEELRDSLDLVVIGAWAGNGRKVLLQNSRPCFALQQQSPVITGQLTA